MRKKVILIYFLVVALVSNAQIFKPVKWTFTSKKTAPNEYDLLLSAKIEKPWHLYSPTSDPSNDAPIPTSFTFNSGKYEAKGKIKELSKLVTKYDEIVKHDLKFFEGEAIFLQHVIVKEGANAIAGSLNFMVCKDGMCLPPEDVDFSFKVQYEKGTGDRGQGGEEKNNTNTHAETGMPSSPFTVHNMDGAPKPGMIHPVKWKHEVKKISDDKYELIFKANIEKGWHIYGLNVQEDGPTGVSFDFGKNMAYQLDGKPEEITKSNIIFDSVLGMKLPVLEGEASFHQIVKVLKGLDSIVGDMSFSACNGSYKSGSATKSSACLAPEKVHFVVSKDEIKAAPASEVKSGNSLWQIFIGGFLGGLAAILTPCVFPMIPLTVSFFTKKKGAEKKSGAGKGLLFGLSIILIYVGIGFIITKLFGANTLNSMASNVYFNLAFFAIFFVFALSFLGAFEITLPSSWTNKADEQSEKGGLIGIFFMAFTLALVSFSCTGPIVGQLLVIAALGGGYAGPITGMFGFSLALALPFTLFAIFPTWMQSLPKSGGWLNSVKVTLGFIELALCLKFLSVVDLTYHWDLLKREYFLVIWIVIFTLLGFYLLGKLKFSHDTDLPFVGVGRLLFAILAFSFAVYMVPGLWGAPLNLLSGLAPPNEYTEGKFTGSASGGASNETVSSTPNEIHKYSSNFHSPLGLNCYYDYDEALAASKKEHKPIMIDFTGHACVNCRKMENTVWADPKVLERLKNDYILVSLYVDDKTDLDPNEVFTSKSSGKEINSLGEKWSDLQASKYGTNSQPWYVLLDENEKQLNEPQGYDADIDKFVRFLDKGKEEFKSKQ